jgi:hypothetical protein
LQPHPGSDLAAQLPAAEVAVLDGQVLEPGVGRVEGELEPPGLAGVAVLQDGEDHVRGGPRLHGQAERGGAAGHVGAGLRVRGHDLGFQVDAPEVAPVLGEVDHDPSRAGAFAAEVEQDHRGLAGERHDQFGPRVALEREVFRRNQDLHADRWLLPTVRSGHREAQGSVVRVPPGDGTGLA